MPTAPTSTSGCWVFSAATSSEIDVAAEIGDAGTPGGTSTCLVTCTGLGLPSAAKRGPKAIPMRSIGRALAARDAAAWALDRDATHRAYVVTEAIFEGATDAP